jgi:hypothetical protein
LDTVWHFNIDFQRRYMFTPIDPDDDLFRINHYMSRDGGKDLCPQQFQQLRLTAQAVFMRKEYLQPLRATGAEAVRLLMSRETEKAREHLFATRINAPETQKKCS